MNHVTYETAVRLKEAGFPQPAPEAGQFWYGKKSAGQSVKGSLCVLIGTPTGALSFSPIDGLKNSDNNFFVFAPTATDILKELGFLIYDEAAAQAWLNLKEK